MPFPLSNVAVRRRRVFFIGTFQVLSHNQIFDSLLDQGNVWLETAGKLIEHLTHKLRVTELLSRPVKSVSQYMLCHQKNAS